MNSSTQGLASNFDTFIIDTSAIINLHKSNYGKKIIQSIPGKMLITQNVSEELNRLKSLVHGTYDFLNQIIEFDNVIKVQLNQTEVELREELMNINSKPQIASGEASVIAVCRYRFTGENCIPIIDDRKGRIAAEKQLHGKECGYSLNLFFHPQVLSKLGTRKLSDAVHQALMNARMSVPKNCGQQVIDFIGMERAKKCTSLPDYKKIFSKC